MKSILIYVKFQKEGIHKYPAALTDPNLESVKFLGYEHRHIFHFKVSISVEHNDRDIEFIMFKRWLESLYSDKTLELNYKSCEMIAEDLYEQINARYPGRDMSIDVSEDNENGAFLEWSNDEEIDTELAIIANKATELTNNADRLLSKLNKDRTI